MKAALLAGIALACGACTSYRTVTAPPPDHVAALDSAHDQLRISAGVAVAFECTTAWGNPCSDGDATVDDPKIARVLPAHLDRLESYMDGTFTPTSYVVVGVHAGTTVLRIPDEDPVTVTVVP